MTANPLRAARATSTSIVQKTQKTGELVYNETTERLHLGDGQTPGGNPLALLSEAQASDATLLAIAALNADAGLLEQTGPDTFTKRAIGVATSASVLTRADADARFDAGGAGAAAAAAVISDAAYNATSWNGDTTHAPSKNAVRDLIEAIYGGVSSAFDTLAEVATELALKAYASVTITGGGLATGGGSLASNRTITVAAASDAEARAGTAIDRAVTPANLNARAHFRVHKNGSSQTGIAPTTQTKLTWSTEAVDVGGHFASDKWTPPAGPVRLSTHLYATGLTSGSMGQLSIYKNGSAYATVLSAIVGTGEFGGCIDAIDVANGTDYYEVFFYGASGGTITAQGAAVYTQFAGEQL